MVINFLSDLHLENRNMQYTHPECDVVVIAGDGAPGTQLVDWIDQNMIEVNVPIIVIAGNHESYYQNLSDHMAVLKKRYFDIGVDFLHNESIVIKDTLFIGGTLWTDFNLFNDQTIRMRMARKLMNDYETIQGINGKIKPEEILVEHNKTVEFISSTLEHNNNRYQTCVVTHHAPSIQSLGVESTNKYAPFYASNLEPLIEKYQPEIWLHGHIHKSVSYFIGETLVLSNPRGRPGDNHNFDCTNTIKI